ncbi:hypothetical protein EDWATA_03771 [Edwardsiella tarda ATCC 23685]|uniref:Uncharacterized protein n=1 Tax=Edwardsiella tarda ATCC 23685 TaxID=500638 RepID=D4FAF3_EDWTA|nr:hypothetical protein EDWATA_03771 [Edwardsiella tarda ATCC 23685]
MTPDLRAYSRFTSTNLIKTGKRHYRSPDNKSSAINFNHINYHA